MSRTAYCDACGQYVPRDPADDDEPADGEWCSTFARRRRGYPDRYVLDEISTNYFLEFDCSPLDGQEVGDCDVLLHRLPPLDEDGTVVINHATRGDVRRLCVALGVVKQANDLGRRSPGSGTDGE